MRKRLYWDLETSPNIGLFWRTGYNLSIGHENIVKERAIICVSYKWEGEEVKTITWDKNQCDKKLLQKLVKILGKATEIVAHNGDRFDLKWVKGRCLFHRIPIPKTFVTIDTCKQARKHFNLNSNRLDYIARYLGLGGKLEHGGFDMWKRIVLHKDKEAMRDMVRYCEKDVVLLEEVYNEMKNYIDVRFNYATYNDSGKFCCPECESSNVNNFNTRTTSAGTIKRQMQCKECNKMYTISNKSYMDLLIFRRNPK